MPIENSPHRPLVAQANLMQQERRAVRQALGIALAGSAALALLIATAVVLSPDAGDVMAFLGP